MADQAPTVLVVEDDAHIADLVDMYLRRDGFRVLQAPDAERGLRMIGEHRPRLVVLDIGLPGDMDGLELCRRLRSEGDLPVLMLTARHDEVDRVLGLELGADDYLTKPFSPRELVARVKAILRRADGPSRQPEVISAGQVEVDLGRRETRVDGQVVPLTNREFDLL
ncbi:MAG TPA: response regulator transcription factor, partial [Acidimicrobiales bacterium]|nr:response regulator transcription factor [Acidimicrobiales bacterium]